MSSVSGERIVEALSEHGIDTVFGIPGNQTLDLNNVMLDASGEENTGEEGMGMASEEVDTPRSLESAVRTAIDGDEPKLIEVPSCSREKQAYKYLNGDYDLLEGTHD